MGSSKDRVAWRCKTPCEFIAAITQGQCFGF
jgi:hypothetical protein